MTQVLIILEQGDHLPSGIVRGFVYRELFAEHGFSATFVARQPFHWLEKLPYIVRFFTNISFIRSRLFCWMRRVSEHRILRLARRADILYLSKVSSHRFLRALRSETQARVVYDFGDAVWLMSEYDLDEFHAILRDVDAVVTDNVFSADYARLFNANCTLIPDAPQIEEFDKRRTELSKKAEDRIVLGWIGSPGTAFNLYLIWEALEELFQRHSNLHLRLVGTGRDLQLIPPFERVQVTCRPFYNQSEMIEEIFGMHIGLFPLQNVERCRTRGILKATVYMSGEAAVVASPVGQCCDFIQDGKNGMLAGSTQEWIDKLEMLISNVELRNRLAQKGLETVQSQFRLDQSFAKLKEVLLAGHEH